MENTFIEKIDGNGVKHYVNPAYGDIFDGKEQPEVTSGSLATFTQDELDSAQRSADKFNAKEYLKTTDWYVTRYAETGIAIPQEISDKRAAARITASE